MIAYHRETFYKGVTRLKKYNPRLKIMSKRNIIKIFNKKKLRCHPTTSGHDYKVTFINSAFIPDAKMFVNYKLTVMITFTCIGFVM